MKVKEYPSYVFRRLVIKLKAGRAYRQEREIVNCVVSLTSFDLRLKKLHLIIGSLFLQSVRPKKIVLWLNKQLKDSVPKSLKKLEGEHFEIMFADTDSSHLKLVSSLLAFPEDVIVTCDDDMLYQESWLESLYQTHLSCPGKVIAHECREIGYDKHGAVLPYTEWTYSKKHNYSCRSLLPLGYGGVLYPPHTLHTDVSNADKYMHLAPKADDLWFKAMSLLNGTEACRSIKPPPKPQPIGVSQEQSLALYNIKGDGNRKQWLAICDYYKLGVLSGAE